VIERAMKQPDALAWIGEEVKGQIDGLGAEKN
jgi:hypothetical protein